mgnify:CR=1 FL=1
MPSSNKFVRAKPAPVARTRGQDPRHGKRHGWTPPRANQANQPAPKGAPKPIRAKGPDPPEHHAPNPLQNGGQMKPHSVAGAHHHHSGGALTKVPKANGALLKVMSNAETKGAVALRTVLPENGPFRFSAMYATVPTAVARPYEVSSYNFAETSPSIPPAAGAALPLGSTQIFLRRSAMQMTIAHKRNDTAATWRQRSDYLSSSASASSTQGVMATGGVYHVSPPRMEAIANPGDILPPFQWNPSHNDPVGGDRRAVFVNANSDHLSTVTLSRYSSFGSPDEDWEVVVYRLHGDAWHPEILDAVTGTWLKSNATHTIPIRQADYYAFELIPAEWVNGYYYAIGMVIEGTSDTWRIDPMPDFDRHYGQANELRLNAASMLVTPECAVAQRSGVVKCVQIKKLHSWVDGIGMDSLEALGLPVTYSFERGAYGYLKPLSAASYEFKTTIHRRSNGLVENVFEPLLTGADTIVFSLEVPQSSTVVAYPAALLRLTTVCALEFTSSSTWLEYGVASLPPGKFAEALEHIAREQQFFENETHVEAIHRFLRAGVDGVLKYGPAVMRIALFLSSML